jgi:pimeloyl-ACP methyl ester carboxylesterase
MKVLSSVLALLLAMCAPAFAQTEVTGTWRVAGSGPSLPTLVLRADGTRLTGTVRVSLILEISEGHISDGHTIGFKVNVPGVMGFDRTIVLRGTMNGDELAFTREIQVHDGDSAPAGVTGMFPPQFVAKRVRDAEVSAQDANQIAYTDQVRGVEYAAAVNLIDKNIKVIGSLFLPDKVSRVRAVIVVYQWGNGNSFYPDPEARRLAEQTNSALLLADHESLSIPLIQLPRNAALGGADALLLLLQRLSQESGHQELRDAPMLFWGHSAAGGWGPTFAALHPQRTIACVLYQSGAGGADMKSVTKIPVLFLKDDAVNTGPQIAGVDSAILWRSGRSAGAPWTFAIQPNAQHGERQYFEMARDLMIPWMTAVIRQRLSADGKSLRPANDGSAWLGNNQTGEVVPFGRFSGSKTEASWLPDEASARGWQAVRAGK